MAEHPGPARAIAARPRRPEMLVRHLGLADYRRTCDAMRTFARERDAAAADELWILQHPPTFTQGQAGRAEHLLCPGDIPVVQTDRGGQTTYHAPGQIVAYPLIDMRRAALGVRRLVETLEAAMVATLEHWGIEARPRRDAPGVYHHPSGAKLAALGLRISRGCSYHGLALNVRMDMAPWRRINACGLGLLTTQMADHCSPCPPLSEVERKLELELVHRLTAAAAP